MSKAALASYLPLRVAHWLFQTGSRDPDAPVWRDIDAAVMFADVSGFTTLADAYAERGSAGAEDLSNLINGYFGRLADLVRTRGGEILNFPGDAAIVVWADFQDAGASLADLLHLASASALELQQTMTAPGLPEGSDLTLRIGIGAGTTRIVCLGDPGQRQFLFASGAPVEAAFRAQAAARPGDVLLAPGLQTMLEPAGLVRVASDHHRLQRMVESRDAAPATGPGSDIEPWPGLESLVPQPVRMNLEGGFGRWLAELRQVSILFLNLRGADYGSDPGLLELQECTCRFAEIVHGYSGCLTELLFDDKGTTLIAAWGLPGGTHEDNATRSIRAAHDLLAVVRQAQLHGSVGVTTGRVFCGDRGNRQRRDYAMIGRTVNRAARLMQVAGDSVVCDADTVAAASGRNAGHGFLPLPPYLLKGSDAPIPIFRSRASGSAATDRPTFGRAREWAVLDDRLQSLAAGGSMVSGNVTLIEGEPGIGKSRLVDDLVARAGQLGVTRLIGGASAIESSAGYLPFRTIFATQLGLVGPSLQDKRTCVLDRLDRIAVAHDCAPLLNELLDLDFPETPFTSQLDGQLRASNTRDILCKLLADPQEARLLVVEDVHWLDSASWALLLQLVHSVPDTWFVLTTRPIGGQVPEGLARTLQVPQATTVRLRAFDRTDVEQLCEQTIGLKQVDSELVDLICEQSGGNPFFVEELLLSLRDSGKMVVIDGVCRLRDVANSAAAALPHTVQGAIESRIDQLAGEQQLALKVASVIGRRFSVRVLQGIFPLALEAGRIDEHLVSMQRLDLLVAGKEPGIYEFRHAITQGVAYGLLLFSQRKELHRAVAQWLEANAADESAAAYQVLVHHWEQAEDRSKTLEYLELAAAQALDNDANDEALAYLQRCLELDGDARASERSRAVERYFGLTEACYRLGRLAESEGHARTLLALLDQPVPASGSSMLWQVGRLLANQLAVRLGLRGSKPAAADREAMLYLLYVRFGRISFFKADPAMAIYATLQNLRVAEALGPSAELAGAYALICAAASFIGQQKLSRYYEGLTLATLDRSGQRDSVRGAHALEAIGLAACGVGRWADVDRYLEHATVTLHRYGDWTEWGSAMQVHARSLADRGDFDALTRVMQPVFERARNRDALQEQQWSYGNRIESILFTSNDLDRAMELAGASAGNGASTQLDSAAVLQGLVATIHFRAGDLVAARRVAEAALRFFDANRPVSFGTMSGYWATAWTLLGCWERRLPGDQADDIGGLAARATAAMGRFAAIFPIGQPRALLCRGVLSWMSGNHKQARKRFAAARDAAQRLGMPYEMALAELEMGRRSEAADQARVGHLTTAMNLFSRLGTAYEIELVRQAEQQSGGN